MNIIQRRILIAGAIIASLMLVFPPFEIPRMQGSAGFHLIFFPPQTQQGYSFAKVNNFQLLTQFVGLLLITALLYLAFGSPRKSNSKIAILEHLSYIIECLSADITGEAKTELGKLIDLVNTNSHLNSSRKQTFADNLVQADECLKAGDYGRAASILSALSRKLWKEILFRE